MHITKAESIKGTVLAVWSAIYTVSCLFINVFLNQRFKLITLKLISESVNQFQIWQPVSVDTGFTACIYFQILFSQYFIANIKKQRKLSIMNEIKPG